MKKKTHDTSSILNVHPNFIQIPSIAPFSSLFYTNLLEIRLKLPRHLDLAMLPAVEVVAPNGFPGNLGKNRCDQELPAAGAASALIPTVVLC